MTHDELPNPWKCEPNCNHEQTGAGGIMPNPNGAGGGIVATK